MIAALLAVVVVVAAAPPEKLFVFDLKNDGVDAKIVAVLEQALVEEADRAGYDAVSGDELRALLDVEAAKQMAGCENDDACLAEVAGGMGAGLLLTGTVTRVARRTTVALTLFDSRKAKVLARESFEVAQSSAARDEIRPAARRLFGLEEAPPATSSLATPLIVTGSIAAAVGVVGVVVGALPLAGALTQAQAATSATTPAAAGVAHDAYTQNAAAWNSYGGIALVVGSALVVGGVAVIAAGAAQ